MKPTRPDHLSVGSAMPASSMIRRRTVAQQAGADETDGEHHRRTDRQVRFRPAMGKADAIDHGPDRLSEIEKTRMQRCGRAARGLRQVGHMYLDAAVQHVEAEA